MNIGLLEHMFNDNTDYKYYIVEYWDKPILIRVPSIILMNKEIHGFKELNELQLSVVRKLNNTDIDCNIDLTNEYPPFQLGMSIKNITRWIHVDCSVKKLLNAVEPTYKFNDYYSIINKIRKEENE